MGLMDTLKHSWNSFFPGTEVDKSPGSVLLGPSYSTRPERNRFRLNNERTIISSIYTRMAIDVAGVRIEHVRLDENDQYLETIKSGLNNCLNVEANIDQAGRHFRQDIPLTLFTEGIAAIVPVDTTLNPIESGSWDIKTMRVGTVLEFYPQHVKVRLYNERTGLREDIILPKRIVAIVENPFYGVMNEPNSTLQRLIKKLSMLDNIDEITSSGKLDIIIQLPYVTKTETRRAQAKQRMDLIEQQLSSNKYGIAYTEATEKVIQLNRSVENNLLDQIKYLKDELYNELGITPGIMNGTATDVEMLNYMNRTIEPIMDAITEAMIRTFLSKTARSQRQSMMYFQTPFKMLSISELAQIADVLSRNQIVTPNEIRPVLGLKPSQEPQANQLVNSNMPLDDQITSDGTEADEEDAEDEIDPAEQELDRQMAELGIT